MKVFLFAFLTILLLLPIIYIVPLGFNLRGKLFITAVSFVLALLGLIVNMYYELWQTLIMLFGFAIIVTYFTEKKLRTMMIYADHASENEQIDKELSYIFSNGIKADEKISEENDNDIYSNGLTIDNQQKSTETITDEIPENIQVNANLKDIAVVGELSESFRQTENNNSNDETIEKAEVQEESTTYSPEESIPEYIAVEDLIVDNGEVNPESIEEDQDAAEPSTSEEIIAGEQEPEISDHLDSDGIDKLTETELVTDADETVNTALKINEEIEEDVVSELENKGITTGEHEFEACNQPYSDEPELENESNELNSGEKLVDENVEEISETEAIIVPKEDLVLEDEFEDQSLDNDEVIEEQHSDIVAKAVEIIDEEFVANDQAETLIISEQVPIENDELLDSEETPSEIIQVDSLDLDEIVEFDKEEMTEQSANNIEIPEEENIEADMEEAVQEVEGEEVVKEETTETELLETAKAENTIETDEEQEEPLVLEEQEQSEQSSDTIELEQIEAVAEEIQNAKSQAKTKFQQQMFHTLVSQIHLSRIMMPSEEYEKLIKEHLSPHLPNQDYYTFAQLLIEHYIAEGNYKNLSKLLTELIDRFDQYPILMEEILYLFDKYCQDIK